MKTRKRKCGSCELKNRAKSRRRSLPYHRKRAPRPTCAAAGCANVIGQRSKLYCSRACSGRSRRRKWPRRGWNAEVRAEIVRQLAGGDKELAGCEGCGRSIFVDLLEIDHKIPKSRGGPSTIENFQLLCRSCNGEKSNRTHDEWMAFRLGHESVDEVISDPQWQWPTPRG